MLKIYNENYQTIVENFNHQVLSNAANDDIIDEDTCLHDMLYSLTEMYGTDVIEGPKIQGNRLVWKTDGKFVCLMFDANQYKFTLRYGSSLPVEVYSPNHSYSECLDEIVRYFEEAIG